MQGLAGFRSGGVFGVEFYVIGGEVAGPVLDRTGTFADAQNDWNFWASLHFLAQSGFVEFHR